MKVARFCNRWRQYSPGDPVPDTLDSGIVDALVRGQKVEWVEELVAAGKAMEDVPNKAMTPERVKTKRK